MEAKAPIDFDGLRVGARGPLAFQVTAAASSPSHPGHDSPEANPSRLCPSRLHQGGKSMKRRRGFQGAAYGKPHTSGVRIPTSIEKPVARMSGLPGAWYAGSPV